MQLQQPPPRRHDNVPSLDTTREGNRPFHPHYQNHFFATIYDSDGANGFDPAGSFDRQNSFGEPFDRHNSFGEQELEWQQVILIFFALFYNTVHLPHKMLFWCMGVGDSK